MACMQNGTQLMQASTTQLTQGQPHTSMPGTALNSCKQQTRGGTVLNSYQGQYSAATH